MSNAGPYRIPSLPPVPPRMRPWAAAAAMVVVVVCTLPFLWPALVPAPLDAADVPPSLVDHVLVFPEAEADLPIATPLAPLLAMDSPESLAVLSPPEGSMRLRRGETLSVRFNRPMVRASEVGRPVEGVLVFTPSVPGTTRWLTRSSVGFFPDARAFDRHIEAQYGLTPGLASVDGAPLLDDLLRVVVFDGTPRAREGASTVPEGAPLEVHFDAPVSVSELAREMFVYERGGATRSVPVHLRSRGWVRQGEGEEASESFVIALDLRRDLEPGAQLGVALAPRFSSWSSSSPHLLSYAIEPRPRIEGIDCQPPSEGWASCSYEGSPGEIVEIGNELVLRASHALTGSATVSVSPPVPNLSVVIDESDTERAHYLTLRADWEADQVYEVRVSGMTTALGNGLLPLAPLAVRSRGYEPQIEMPMGLLTFESDAPLALPLRGIHVEAGSVRTEPISLERARSAVLGLPDGPAGDRDAVVPLSRLLPTARSNRWGRGRLTIEAPEGPSLHQVTAQPLSAAAMEESARRPSRAVVVRTDLAMSTLAVPGGITVWVTSIRAATPVAGVTVTAYDAAGAAIAHGRTDGQGLAWLAGARLTTTAALVTAEHEGDAAILRVDERIGVTGAALDLPGGTRELSDEESLRAIVRTDRGIFRPGETLEVLGLVRRVRGIEARAARVPLEARLVGFGMDAATVAVTAESSRFGMVSVRAVVPRETPLGEARVELLHEGVVLGSATIQVAEYREPRFRVDVNGPSDLVLGERAEMRVEGRYLFGAALEGDAHVTVTRRTGATFGAFEEFDFAPVGTALHATTISEEVLTLSGGSVSVPITAELAAPTRSVITLEADVTDVAGQASAGSRRIVLHPAAIEVGIARAREWLRWGEPIDAEVIAIDAANTPVVGASIEVRFLREGWHGWWEWSDAPTEDEGAEGSYALRRGSRREVVHTCTVESGTESVHCVYAPTRPGTYRMEVESHDAEGRRSLASRRVYVAGPDESPDRDPPGASIEITPRAARVRVGETAEIAFECPWPEAEALVVVSRQGVLFTERRRVSAGGQVVQIPVTEAMAPNAFITLTLVRPRTGEPDARLDLHAPDLRFGAAELVVRAPLAPLTVSIADADELAPGRAHGIEIEVRDAEGAPVEAELAVWASDEGTLRATGYALGSLEEDLFGRAAAAFSLEDSRRTLRSRLDPLIEADPSGDGGGDAGGGPMALPERDRYEPTPLFLAHVITDAHGHATVPFTPPDRLTTYRVYAVATAADTRVGSDESERVVSRALLVQPMLPRFLTEGDEAEIGAFVHNRTDAAMDAVVRFVVDGASGEPLSITVPARDEVAVRSTLHAASLAPITVSVEVESVDGVHRHALTEHVAVSPNGRWVRQRTLVMGPEGVRSLGLTLPAGTSARGTIDAVVAAHPFVGLEGLADGLEATTWSTGWLDASAVLALASVMRLEAGSVSGIEVWRERRAHLEARLRSLLARQGADGGIARYAGESSDPEVNLLALEAILAARGAGVSIEDDVLSGLVERVDEDVREGRFGAEFGAGGLNQRMRAVHRLTQAGRHTEAFVESAYATREFLDAAGLAELASCMARSDGRRATVVAAAEARAGIERSGARRASLSSTVFRSPAMLTALLELEAARLEETRPGDASMGTRRVMAPLAGELLATLEAGDQATRARALSALVTVAERFRGASAPRLSLSLDGTELVAERSTDAAAHFTLPFGAIRTGEHALAARRGVPEDEDHGPVFLAVSGLWTVPVSDLDRAARGRVVALHRVYETPGGTPIEAGSTLSVGDLVRVRLFVFTEGASPEEIALRDPHAAGLEPIDAGLETSPNAALLSVLGASPGDDVADPRAYHAMRSEWDIRQRAHEAHATTFYLRRIEAGLHEYTYVVRATTAGTFAMPPAQIDALFDPSFVARSTASSLRVVR